MVATIAINLVRFLPDGCHPYEDWLKILPTLFQSYVYGRPWDSQAIQLEETIHKIILVTTRSSHIQFFLDHGITEYYLRTLNQHSGEPCDCVSDDDSEDEWCIRRREYLVNKRKKELQDARYRLLAACQHFLSLDHFRSLDDSLAWLSNTPLLPLYETVSVEFLSEKITLHPER